MRASEVIGNLPVSGKQLLLKLLIATHAMKKLRNASYCLALAASALAGDHYDVVDSFINPVRHHGELMADGFYRQPFRLRKEYRVNDQGFLEVYFGDKEMHPVSDELRVNERKLGERIKDETKEMIRNGKKKLEGLLEDVNEVYEEAHD